MRIDLTAASSAACVLRCKGQPCMEEGRLKVDQQRIFGCIGCGHCMLVCPKDCIEIRGRDLSPEDVILCRTNPACPVMRSFTTSVNAAQHPQLPKRRVEPEVIARIVEAVQTAPMGLPPSDVEILILMILRK